jgi:hypothetical protein
MVPFSSYSSSTFYRGEWRNFSKSQRLEYKKSKNDHLKNFNQKFLLTEASPYHKQCVCQKLEKVMVPFSSYSSSIFYRGEWRNFSKSQRLKHKKYKNDHLKNFNQKFLLAEAYTYTKQCVC